MELSYREKEDACLRQFMSISPLYHICTSENYEIIFVHEKEFEDAIGILGICSKLFPNIKIYTFQFMNNHFHLLISGNEAEIRKFLNLFIGRLQKHLIALDRNILLENLDVRIFPIDSLEYARAAIAYVNRNGFIVNSNFSPYSYPWGSNSCFFNKIMRNYYDSCKKYVTINRIRSLVHSKIGDSIKDLYSLGDGISPLSFCEIGTAENIFRDEKNYFYHVSKNVEFYGRIAKDIGEMVCYTDDDIYQIARTKAKQMSGTNNPALLNSEEKLTLAKELHYDYNSTKKQIHRILKLEMSMLDSLF